MEIQPSPEFLGSPKRSTQGSSKYTSKFLRVEFKNTGCFQDNASWSDVSTVELLGSPNKQERLNKINITHGSHKWCNREAVWETPRCYIHPGQGAQLAVKACTLPRLSARL